MKTSILFLCFAAFVLAVVADEYKAPQFEKKYDGYFQYANVPGPYEYEFGYNRGNPSHHRSHYEQSKDHRFRTKVKWADSYDGYGEHYWEYNHGDYSAPAAYSAPSASYAAPAGGYAASSPIAAVKQIDPQF